METKHTKTEWVISDQGANGVFISSGIGSEVGAIARVYSENSLIKTAEEGKANANLIVSAPLMLQALISIRTTIFSNHEMNRLSQSGKNWQKELDEIDSVINQAVVYP